jgi:hypothetical protein
MPRRDVQKIGPIPSAGAKRDDLVVRPLGRLYWRSHPEGGQQ